MKKYKCCKCETIFDEDEAGSVEEYHSEVHASEYFMVCPKCGSDDFMEYVERSKGEWFVYSIDTLTRMRKGLLEGKYKNASDCFNLGRAVELKEIIDFLSECEEEEAKKEGLA